MNLSTCSADWTITPEKIQRAVACLVEAANPLQVILFGSRARGDERPDSDVDLAVIVDVPEDRVRQVLPAVPLRGIGMEVTLIVVSKEKYDLHRPWRNSVFYNIDREGVVLYDRNDQESSHSDVMQAGGRGRVDTTVSAA